MGSGAQRPAGADRPRTLEEAKTWMQAQVAVGRHPFDGCDPDTTGLLIDSLPGLDGSSWGRVWVDAGDEARAAAAAAEARGDHENAQAGYRRAAKFYFLGRYPCPNHPLKQTSAEKERDAYLAAERFRPIPTDRVTVPFPGREGEGGEVVFLHRRPPGVDRPAVVVMWGGVDAWKEQLTVTSDAFLAEGLATVALDNPGTGESPVAGSRDAERQFLPVLDWIAARTDLDGGRVGLFGRSFGGHWATKLAHLHPERVAGAVSWAGGVHHMFQPEWVEASRHPDSYLMELVETRARMLGTTVEEYPARFAELSLLDQGILDRPCAPLLLVNGKHDTQCPVEDIFLLLEHGSPKSVRLFDGGHMGHTPRTHPLMVEWLTARLRGDDHPKATR